MPAGNVELLMGAIRDIVGLKIELLGERGRRASAKIALRHSADTSSRRLLVLLRNEIAGKGAITYTDQRNSTRFVSHLL